MNHNNFIIRDGWPLIFSIGGLAVVAALLGICWLTGLLIILTAFCACFFRNPERKVPADPNAVLSPADGRVIKIEDDVAVSATARGSFKKVSIFMNIFNVHVNRIPCSGRVAAVEYKKGKFLSANLDKASEMNERNAVLIKMDDGRDLLVVQIAGLIARRIVCWVAQGMAVERGQRFGLIRFGSRLEVFLPCDARFAVKIGDKVKAGETPIGYLQ